MKQIRNRDRKQQQEKKKGRDYAEYNWLYI